MIKPKIHPRRYPSISIVDVSDVRSPRRPQGGAQPASDTGGRRHVVRANIVRLIPGRTRLPFASATV